MTDQVEDELSPYMYMCTIVGPVLFSDLCLWRQWKLIKIQVRAIEQSLCVPYSQLFYNINALWYSVALGTMERMFSNQGRCSPGPGEHCNTF